jgi:hypothetical protein
MIAASPDQEANSTLPSQELKDLDQLAHTAIGYLVLASTGALIGAYVLAKGQYSEIAPTSLTNLPSAMLYGFSGSAVAALTSCLDRYATGFEREDGSPFPANAKVGEGKFNRRFSRWLFVRPFLGAVIAPIFLLGISHFVKDSQQWNLTAGFTAFTAGLLAKSVVDLIKRLFKDVFRV